MERVGNPFSISEKEKVLDFCQGARCLSFSKETLCDRFNSSEQKRRKKFNAASVFLADSFAHDIIDRFLSYKDTPTVCKFALMHRCAETSLGIPCVDNHFISAPCCMAPLYKLEMHSTTVFETKHFMSCNDINLGNASVSLVGDIFPGTSTPKQWSSRQTNRLLDTERQVTSSTSSGSSCTCEHHETPSGLNSQQFSDFKYSKQAAGTKFATKNQNPRHLAFKSNSFSEPSCSYGESLHVNTNMQHLCRKLFQQLPSENSEGTEKKDSMESVIRHPSYFSDSEDGGINVDMNCMNSDLNNSVFIETRSNCCSPFKEEVPLSNGEPKLLENKKSEIYNKSVETQTNSSFLLQMVEKSKQKLTNLNACSIVVDPICDQMGDVILDSCTRSSSLSSMSDIFVVVAEESVEKVNTAAIVSV